MNEYERWETRYAVPEYAFGKDPNYFLASCKTLLPKSGRVLGHRGRRGTQRRRLAKRGLDVLSIDFSPSAQKKACTLAAERHVNVAFQQVDVHTLGLSGSCLRCSGRNLHSVQFTGERALKWVA